MLDYDILGYKEKITKDNNLYIDLLSKSYNDKMKITGNYVMSNEHYIARPDLISLAVYGDDKYADILCKINGISNPFELSQYDILFCPSVEFITGFTKSYGSKSDLIDNPKNNSIVEKDKNDLRKQKNERRTPNDMLVGEESFVIDKSLGLVFY